MHNRYLLTAVLRMRPGCITLLVCVLACAACHRGPVLPGSSSRATGVYHTVKKGQTLWRICHTYKVSMQDVAELNNITDHSQIRSGDRLFIPGADRVLYVPSTASAPSGSGSRQRGGGTPEPSAPVIEKNVGMFIWPLIGPVVKRFGIHGGLKHDGIDIKGRAHADVRASRSGTVIFAAWLEGYGNTVIVQHTTSYVTVYANLGASTVRQDQQVKQAQVLGRLAAGPADACYLHFQVRRDRKARNPLFYLPKAR